MTQFKTTAAYLSGGVCGHMWMPNAMAGKPLNANARGHKKNGTFEYNDEGHACLEIHRHDRNAASYVLIPDRETGAKKRLAKILARYPDLRSYVQGDPRGASLYILEPGNVPEGESIDAYYNRGIAVYK
jgi:hypothetical protein